MKRILTSILTAVIFCTALSAQRTTVTGDVLDALTRQGEPAAVLQFFCGDETTPIAYTTTDMDGFFSQPLRERSPTR